MGSIGVIKIVLSIALINYQNPCKFYNLLQYFPMEGLEKNQAASSRSTVPQTLKIATFDELLVYYFPFSWIL